MYIIRKKEKRALPGRKKPGDEAAGLKADILSGRTLEESLRDLSEKADILCGRTPEESLRDLSKDELRAIAEQDHVTEIDGDAWDAFVEEKRKKRKASSRKPEK